MKHWNKHPEIRKQWTCVTPPWPHATFKVGASSQFKYLYTTLQNAPGGKFYMTERKREIWFERAVDATWFRLTHL